MSKYHLTFCPARVGAGNCVCPDHEAALRMIDELQVSLNVYGSRSRQTIELQSERRRMWWARQTPETRAKRIRSMADARLKKAAAK